MIRKIWNNRIFEDSKHLIKTACLLLLQIARTRSFKLAKSFAMMLTRRMDRELCTLVDLALTLEIRRRQQDQSD